MGLTKVDSTKDWTDREWDKFNEWITGVLKETTVKIVFSKKDGTERTMHCTLKENLLPTRETKRQIVETTKPKEYIAVYDTVEKGWRSFVIKNVKSFEFEIKND
jgi:hypothetical protein